MPRGGLIHLAPFSPSFPKAHIFGQSSSSGVVTREGSQKDSAPMGGGHWGHWDTTPDMDVHPGVSLVPVEAALMGPTQPSPEVDPGAPQCSGGHSWERNISQLSPKSMGWSEMADGTVGGGTTRDTDNCGPGNCGHLARPAAISCPWHSKGTCCPLPETPGWDILLLSAPHPELPRASQQGHSGMLQPLNSGFWICHLTAAWCGSGWD